MSMLQSIKKKITKLETELAQLHAAAAAFGAKPTARRNKPGRKPAAKPGRKAAAKAKPRASRLSGKAPIIPAEVLTAALSAIGSSLPAMAVKAAFADAGIKSDSRGVLAKLKKLGCIRVEGEKRHAVWHATGLSVSAALAIKQAKTTEKADAAAEAEVAPTTEAVAQA